MQKIKILKTWKTLLEISFYTRIPKIKIIWCMIPEIWSTRDRIFSHFGPFFALSPPTPLTTQRTNILKNWKKSYWYHHVTQVYHKWQSYDIWLLRYQLQQTDFFYHFGLFFNLYPLTAPKMKISQKWRKRLEISSFYTSAPKIMIIGYIVPEIRHMTDVIAIFHFGIFFALLQ